MTRKWLPSDWMDEMPPQMADNPSDFLKRNAAGVLQLTPLDDCGVEPADIEPGAEVAFCWVDRHDSILLTVFEGGTWSVVGDIPDTANNFFYDWDIMAPTLGDLVKGDPGFTDPLTPGEYDIDVATWSEGLNLFQVRVLESGAAEFAELQRPAAIHADGNQHPVAS